jgi:hypothetical protein
MERYVAVQEPTCTWAVFDIFEDVPAEFEGRVLVGLGKAEAVLFASAANAREMPPAAMRDGGAVNGRPRPAIADDAPARRRKLPLDGNGDGAEKSPARTWRNW